MNISGEGVERDMEKAQDYLERAAELGNEDASEILQKLPEEKLLDEGRIAVEMGEYERAFAIYEKLAKAGSADGMFNCGVMFVSGVGVKKIWRKLRSIWRWRHQWEVNRQPIYLKNWDRDWDKRILCPDIKESVMNENLWHFLFLVS